MRFTLSATFALVASLGLAAACGSTTTTTEEPVATATATDMPTSEPTSVEPTATAPVTSQPTASAPPTSTTPPAPAKKAWKDLNHDEKLEVMKAEVMPKMTKMFQEFDGKKFAKMDCATCHGKADKTMKMPNPALPKLDPADGFKKHAAKNQAMLEFMFKMTPEMAKTINAEPFNPSTNTGFGCFSCHTMDPKAKKP
jgi:hypothetical protein